MYAYRVFLSYSSAERDLATAVADVLRELGLQLLSDHALIPGQPFSDEIKAQILRSHLFVPLLTRKSLARPWVHQETGYAMGVGVPILPIVVGRLVPVALIQQLQAIRIDQEPAELKGLLTEDVIAARVDDAASTRHASFEVVDLPERRAETIVGHARDAQRRGGVEFGKSGPLRLLHFLMCRRPTRSGGSGMILFSEAVSCTNSSTGNAKYWERSRRATGAP